MNFMRLPWGRGQFVDPDMLIAFLAHPMTGLTEEQIDAVADLNRVIVRGFESIYSPGFVWYDPANDYSPSLSTESDTYINDFSALIGADLLVVNAYCRADGIGMLVQEAAKLHMQIIIVASEDRILTPLFHGLPIRPQIITATTAEGLANALPQALRRSLQAIRYRNHTLSNDRDSLYTQIPGVKLCNQRIRNGLTIEMIANSTGFTAEFLHNVECDSRFLLMSNQTGLRVLSSAYGVESITYSPDGMQLQFQKPSQMYDDVVHHSLRNLASYYVTKSDRYSRSFDRAALSAWYNYLDQRAANKTKDPGGRNFDFPVLANSLYDARKRPTSNGWDRRIEGELGREGLL